MMPFIKKYKWILIAVLFIGIQLLSLKVTSWYWKRKFKNELKEQKQQLTDSLTASFEAQKQLLDSGKKQTTATKKKATNIDTKLKEDEKAIDNSPVTDIELREFLAEYD